MKENLVKEKSFEFAIHAIECNEELPDINEIGVSKQFVKIVTGISTNIEKAFAGISKRDFIAKMSIASKEAREVLYWLKLIEIGGFIQYDFKVLKEEAEQLIKILTAIVKTSQFKINS